MSRAATVERFARHTSSSGPHALRLVAAFAAIYLIWGSTYLAIKVLVTFAPPLLMAAARCLAAGVILFIWAGLRGTRMPTRGQWTNGLFAGALMFLVGHGTLFWASQRVPSGFAAILVATIPIWVVAFGAIGPRGSRPDKRTQAGLALGIGGVAWLNLPYTGGGADRVASAALLIGAAAWGGAIHWYKGPRRPDASVLAAAIPLVTGGALLLGASALFEHGEPIPVSTVPLVGYASFAYLVVFGSVVAFSAFAWLINVASPAAVASYAFVNPIVAVILGWAIGNEAFTSGTLLPAAAIIASVVLIGTRNRAVRKP